ncbi:MAG: efflux RND transporter periplasmic adaptor subunit [Planctomycetia bacterium]|nr:efflux RND transporter periplasmic adaptor subunit [Planctomycetia bacterium]
MKARNLLALTFIVSITLLTGCIPDSGNAPQGRKDEADAALPAKVVPTISRRIIDYVELTGRTAAVESVDVRAQVSGYLEQINFQAGSFVQKGQTLFTLDSRVYRAVLAQRKSDVAAKSADLQHLEAELARQRSLIDKNATSQQQLELALAERDKCAAELEAARANVERAQIDLDYATIVSPIAGQVSREQITVGNLVTSGSTTLTRVVAVDPIHVFFDVDERTLLTFRRHMEAANASENAFEIKFAIGDGEFDHTATVDFAEPQINATTGTLEFRAVAQNPLKSNGSRELIPGLRLKALFPTSPEYDAILVPEEAIVTDQNVKRVWRLAADNHVESVPVTLGPIQSDNMRVVATGLNLGDRVITDNLLKIRPDSVIEPILAEPISETRITREDGTVVNPDGSVEYDGLYEWSVENQKDNQAQSHEEYENEEDNAKNA